MRGVLVVGSCNVDYVVECDVLPAPGDTVLGRAFHTAFGGKGANQAVAAARLGARVAIVGRVGADAAGTAIVEALAGDGVDTTVVVRDTGAPTGVALIVVDRTGQNQIAVAPGANARVRASDTRAVVMDLDGDVVVLAQLEVPVAAVLAAFRGARRVGLRTMLNAAPAQSRATLADVLRATNVLVVNEGEAAQLAEMPVTDRHGALAAARSLRDVGPDLVVVTLGADGAVAVSGADEIVQPAFPVRVVDATGAGDAFCGALAVWLDRVPLREALALAAAAGALATTKRGAQPALPTARAVQRLVREAAQSPR